MPHCLWTIDLLLEQITLFHCYSLLFFILGAGQIQPKTYYVQLSIKNQSPKDVTISYLDKGELQERDMPKNGQGSISLSFTSSQQPPAIEFKAFEKGTNNAVKLNGNDNLVVVPMEQLIPVSVTIAGEGNSFLYHIKISMLCLHFVPCELLFINTYIC